MEKLVRKMDNTTEKVYKLFVQLARKMFKRNKVERRLSRRRGR